MTESLADAITAAGGPVTLLRNAQAAPTVFPVRSEFSNWRSEQRAWRESVALLDQSHHMTDLFISGPDALRLLTRVGVNSFAKFSAGRAKQFIAVNHEGFLIGDAILFHLDDGEFDLVGHPMVIDWVQFHGETGGYDVSFERDGNSIVRSGDPKLYRYELQGPNALALMEKVTGAPVPETRFFHMADFSIGPPSALAAPRNGGAARLRTVRAVGGGRHRARRDHRRGRGVRPRPCRLEGLLVGEPRVGVGALSPCPRSSPVSRRTSTVVAAGTIGRIARGQPVVGEHRGLLRHSVRPRLRPQRRIRPRLHRPRSTREDRREPGPPQGDAGVERG